MKVQKRDGPWMTAPSVPRSRQANLSSGRTGLNRKNNLNHETHERHESNPNGRQSGCLVIRIPISAWKKPMP
jgi:hypothetical protein